MNAGPRRRGRLWLLAGPALVAVSVLVLGSLLPPTEPPIRERRTGGPSPTPAQAREVTGAIPPDRIVPEGRLLLTGPGGTFTLEGTGERVRLGGDLVPHALSPDGERLLATVLPDEDGRIELVVVHLPTANRTTVLEAATGERITDARWSPDATAVSYVQRLDGSPPRAEGRVCVLPRIDEEPRCIPSDGIPGLRAHSWSPEGDRLVVAADELLAIDIETGEATPFLEPIDVRSLEAALSTQGLEAPVGFEQLAWAPSGHHLATLARFEGDLLAPVMFRANGRLASVGRVGDAASWDLAWSPADVYLAYTRHWIFADVLTHAAGSGDDRVAVTKAGSRIERIAWSPSGRWLASEIQGREQGIIVLDTVRAEPPRVIDERGLRGWAP